MQLSSMLATALISVVLLLQPATPPSAPSADELAAAVMKASGADVWPKVTRVKFTFVAGKNPRAHDWDVKNHTDTITVNGKSTTAKLNAPNVGEAKQAFGAWTNDSYWLMAPLKVMDPGVIRATQPDETIDGKSYHVLHLSFKNVGMTPSDQYNLFVDPETNLVRHWDYIPARGQPRRFTWDEYKDFNGLKLSTDHKINGTSVIKLADVEVTTE